MSTDKTDAERKIENLKAEYERLKAESKAMDAKIERRKAEIKANDEKHKAEIKAMDAKTEELMAKIEKHKAEIKAMDAEIKAKDAKTEELMAKIEKHKAEIKAKNAEIYHNSIEEMLKKFSGLPDLSYDQNLTPIPHENKNRKTFLKLIFDEKLIEEEDLRFKIKSKDEKGRHHKSMLDTAVLHDNKLLCHNKASVGQYVEAVVMMCLKSLGCFGLCTVYHEMSLFSLRPDLVLLKHPQKGIILIIEVKMPGDTLTTSDHIAEKLADYLLLQRRQGNEMPLVLLSSYNKACICHLKSAGEWTVSNAEKKSKSTSKIVEPGNGHDHDDSHRRSRHGNSSVPTACVPPVSTNGATLQQEKNYRSTLVEKASQLLKDNKGLNELITFTKEDETDKKHEKRSPEKFGFGKRKNIPSISMALTTKEQRLKRKVSSPSIKHLSPEVVYSKSFELTHMMQFVSLAIVCGLISIKKMNRQIVTESIWPAHGSYIDGLHPCVEEDSFGWSLVENMQIDYVSPPLSGLDEKYLLLQEIGRSRSSRVFLAVNVKGFAFALKFYLEHDSTAQGNEWYSHKECQEEHIQYVNAIKEKIANEIETWNTLQSTYKPYVKHLQLNRLQVLRMPVFAPVPPDRRLEILPLVKEKLVTFFNKGFMYNELWWQHVGCRRLENTTDASHGMQIVMLGMELLVAKGDNTMLDLEAQIETLRERSSSERFRPYTNILF